MINPDSLNTGPFLARPVDQLCDLFVVAWRLPRRPKIEEFLGATVEPERSALFCELLALELELRRDAGEEPIPGEYELCFPEYAALVKTVLGKRAPSFPEQIGRYKVSRRLGGGGFGHVYLCYDEMAERAVAIKLPRRDRLNSVDAMQAFLREARNVACLDHVGIVPLYDFGEANGQCYLVYKFIEGLSLAARLRQGPVPHDQGARIIAQVADALHHAHGKNLFHRDIKPGNILLDRQGQPHLTDFGLAVREEDLPHERSNLPGTYPYMSPEQLRGEGHRIDGRTDIYSLGVVLYELLSGRRPFEGPIPELIEQILHRDPRPLRQFNDTVPRELERISLKAMAKQMNARFLASCDMAEELRQALAQAAPNSVPAASLPALPLISDQHFVRVVPKGLRSFGPEDSEFFLELLPGPRDRFGLPDSIRFWRTRLETRDEETALAVGLIYGPSGSGKSSLMKAGILPRLAPSVLPVYLEATRENTEARLVNALRKAYPRLNPEMALPDTLAHLRMSRALPNDSKVLLVLDQFEQWLHAHGHDMENTELVAALRQVDGEHVQVILMVRDDFWMGVSRLFDVLEINLDRARNARAVDLFDMRHARHVLRMFGQAYDRLPAEPAELKDDQANFLDRAVAELSQDGRVIPVRLSLFADLMKERPWTSNAFIEVGGTDGVGVRFLEETFTARTALPELRAMETPARVLLQALLPERGMNIKGRMRSRHELAATCRLGETSSRFARLLELLDRELHIITPTESEHEREERGREQSSGEVMRQPPSFPPESVHRAEIVSQTSYYQLTHDYLIPPLRQWLTQERRKTWRGRAGLCLDERTAQWTRSPERRFLPSALEYLTILLGVPWRRREPEQRALMRAATRLYILSWGSALGFLLVLALIVELYISSVHRATRVQRTENQVQILFSSSPEGVPFEVEKLKRDQDIAKRFLQAGFQDPSTDFQHRLRASFALSTFGEVEEAFLLEAIAKAPPAECKNIVAALLPIKDRVASELLARASDARTSDAIRVRYATVLLHLQDPRAAQRFLAFAPDPTQRTTFIHNFKAWHGDLRPLADLVEGSDNASFRAGLCAAFGLIEPDALDSIERSRLQQALSELYLNAPDAVTHSTSGWALRQWQAKLPVVQSSRHAPDRREWFVNSQGMTMLEVKPGTFLCRDPDDEESKPHRVTLARPFFMCDREVSVDEFQQFMHDSNAERPQGWPGADPKTSPTGNCPVQRVNWLDAVLFCNWLSRKERLEPCYQPTGAKEKVKIGNPMDKSKELESDKWEWHFEKNGYRLPTEAEWEYACRAGTITSYAFGEDSTLLRDYGVAQAIRTASGGSHLPNAWGFFDMHGNVLEWCWDFYAIYPNTPVTDPRGPETGSKRVLRGGCYLTSPPPCCSGVRGSADYNSRLDISGFRVVCGVEGAKIN